LASISTLTKCASSDETSNVGISSPSLFGQLFFAFRAA
jgi:hypothetical protein